ncbi:MAG TPA: tetratricopeptide repeat protein [Verrucomicrobiae bacterium]|nr:tetratricopeptide repeat protein [Verrucomicrobiae bacterium]
MSGTVRHITGALLLAAPFATFAHSEVAKLAPGDVRPAGRIDFATTCKQAVQPEFNRAVALLHSFFYEEARNIFTQVALQDPSCAMAQWGIAQSWWHPIWAPPNAEEMAAGRAAADKAMDMKASARERGFIEAIDAYYNTPEPKAAGPVGQSCHGPIGPRERVIAYEQATKKVLERFPKDVEAQVFHAFAVVSVGYATPLDKTLANQKAAGAMLEQVWKTHRQHPGVAHYLIHAYDYPALATRALEPARAYAEIAPWVPHALHMPSHIFTRLGMWDEAIAGNQASAEASRKYALQRKRNAAEVEELHALDYQMYSYLQQGRDAESRAVLDAAVAVPATYPEHEFIGAYALAAMPARYALERNAWPEAAALAIPARPHWAKFPFTEALFEYAHALGRAHTGDIAGARKAVERMSVLRDASTDPKFEYFRKHVDLQTQAASAWLAQAEGRGGEAIEMLRAAADAEDALGKHPVTPGALVPAREQLGEVLLAQKRYKEAQQAYEASLAIYPARFNALYGAATAAELAGERKVARKHYEALLRQSAKANPQRPELAKAKAFVAAADAGGAVVSARREVD